MERKTLNQSNEQPSEKSVTGEDQSDSVSYPPKYVEEIKPNVIQDVPTAVNKDGEEKLVDSKKVLKDGEEETVDSSEVLKDGEEKSMDPKEVFKDVEKKTGDSKGVFKDGEEKTVDSIKVLKTDQTVVDGDQFTDPEILDSSILDQSQPKSLDDESEFGNTKLELLGKQQVEPIFDSSSEEEMSVASEKKIKRRKKRPRNTDKESMDRHKKMQAIQEVLSSSPLDIEKLRELAVGDGGLVKDELRRKAWPRLMMIEHMEVTPKPTLDVVKAHKDYHQVVLDVNRSLKRFPPGIDDDYRLVLMDQLTTLIIRVLIKHPDLHYYQGFHDVAITFLLVMGEDVGFEMVEKLAVTHLCDFMRPTMEKTTYYLTYLYPVLKRADPTLHQFLIDSGVGTVFCLPWLITWFAHTLSDYRNVVRLYDFFLATPYLMPMYIASAIVLKKKQDILSGECDMAMQHFILSQVPDSLPFEEILIEANILHDAYPPDTLHEEVDEFIKKKNEEEALERQQLMKRKKKFDASRRGQQYREIMYMLSRYNPIPPAQTKMIVKVAFFAVTAYFATSLYSYYSESPSLFPFSTRQ